MMRTLRTALLTLAAALLLAGCGWQLRGAGLVPEGLETLHITSRDPYSPLVVELTRTLRAANVQVTESAAEAPPWPSWINAAECVPLPSTPMPGCRNRS